MPTVAEEFDQATVEAWITNTKAMYDAWQSDSQQQARQRQTFQDQVNQQYLRFVEDAHALTQRTADFNAAALHKNSEAMDAMRALILAGEIDTTAQGTVAAKLAEEFRSVAKQAVEAAVAAVPGTSAASQGTTGVAQGALQTVTPVAISESLSSLIQVNKALAVELAEVVKALAAVIVKVTGEETTAVVP